MKISKLHIDSFRHLENLDFDFTYPQDFHIEEKRGKPLDKICFIGQSATGKTGLLELIYEHTQTVLNLEVVNQQYLSTMKHPEKKLSGISEFTIKGNIFKWANGKAIYRKNSHVYQNIGFGGQVTDLISKFDKNNVLYFKTDLISDINITLFSTNPINLTEKYINELHSIENTFTIKEGYGIIFDGNAKPKLWLYTINKILQYRISFTKKMSEFIQSGLLANVKKLDVEFQKWQKINPNKLEDFAKKFNPLLEKLNLEVDLISPEYAIPLRNKRNEEVIPIQNTSTGTKGLLLTFLPLYELDTKDSIILIDEPERSLYPDMQMDLMEHYQNLAPEAQFIVATHSPFIAASFEPEERFILYFDNEGKVAVRQGNSPIGDDPNDMLKNDFGVDYYNQFGKDAYKKYLKLKEDLAKEKNKDKKKELLLETVKLGDTYNF